MPEYNTVSNTSSGRRGGRGGSSGRGGRSNGIGAVRKPARQPRSSNMMDVDQGPSGRPIGRFPMTAGKKGGKRGAGAARGGRGGARGGKKGERKPKPTKENLDMDLDKYMMKDPKTAKSNLDNDLDSYMLGATDLPQQIG